MPLASRSAHFFQQERLAEEHPQQKAKAFRVYNIDNSVNISNSNNHSVSMDRHMLKQKYDNIQELINS